MAEYDENRLTDLMEFVGQRLVGDEWAKASMNERRIMKENVLPVALAVFDFVEANPNEKVLAIKEALQYTFMEYNGVLPDQEEGVLDAWNAAFPEHPLDLTDTGEEYEE